MGSNIVTNSSDGSLVIQDELLTQFIALLKSFFDFDKTQEKPYGLVDAIYKQAQMVKNVSDQIGAHKKQEYLDIPLGNLKMVIDNFLENKPLMIMNKQEVLNAKDLAELQNKIKKENEVRKTMIEMEKNWHALVQKFVERNVQGTILLPDRPTD